MYDFSIDPEHNVEFAQGGRVQAQKIRTGKGQGDLVGLVDVGAGRGAVVRLVASIRLVALEDYDPSVLPILPREVLRLIGVGDSAWESMVPEKIAEVIKRRGFFGYPLRG